MPRRLEICIASARCVCHVPTDRLQRLRNDGPRVHAEEVYSEQAHSIGGVPSQRFAREPLDVAATGYHCPTHGDFKVADTVFAEAKAKGYTREQWEAALEKAEQRTEPDAEPDEWPLIITDDFF